MQIQMHDQTDACFPVKILGIDLIALYGTCVNLSCISYACYANLRDPPSSKTLPAMSVHSGTGHDLCPVVLMCGEITIGMSQFKNTVMVCKMF